MARPIGQLTIQMAADLVRLRTDMQSAQRTVGGAMANITTSVQKAQQSVDGIGASLHRTMSGLKQVVAGAFSVYAIFNFTKALIDAGVAMQRLQKQFMAAFGSEKLGAGEMDYLRGVVQRLGLDLVETAGAYAKFSAALRETNLEGERGRKVFEGFATAATALSLTAPEFNSVMLALQQMMSKGTVMAEEMRLQLNERLPGAYRVAARVMGMTTKEFAKQMELGNIIAAELLPKMAEEFEKTYGEAAVKGATMAQAEFNKLKNLMFELKTAASSTFMDPLLAGVRLLTTNINATKDAIVALVSALAYMAGGKAVVSITAMTRAYLANAAAAKLAAQQAAMVVAAGARTAGLFTGLAAAANTTAVATAAAARSFTLFGVAAAGVSRVITFLGGPIGAIITLLGVAASAWGFYASRQEEAANTKTGADKVIADLEEEIKLLRERRRLREEEGQDVMDMPQIDDYLRAMRKAEMRLAELRKIMGGMQPGQMTADSPISREYYAELDKIAKLEKSLHEAKQERSIEALRTMQRETSEAKASYEAVANKIKSLNATLVKTKEIMDATEWVVAIPQEKRTLEQEEIARDYYKAALQYLNAKKELEAATKKQKKAVDEYADALEFMTDQEKAATKAAEERLAAQDKALKDSLDAYYDEVNARSKGIVSAQDYVKQVEFEAQALKMSNTEREIAIQLMALEKAGLDPLGEEYRMLAEEIRNAVTARDAVKEGIEQQKKYADEWEKTSEQIGAALANALMEGGKSAWDYIVGLFRNLVFKVPLQQLATGVVASLGLGGTAMAADGMGSAVGLGGVVSSLKTAFGVVENGFTSLGGIATSLGESLAYNFGGAIESLGIGIQNMAGVLNPLFAGAAGVGIGTMLAGNYQLGGMGGMTTSAIGAGAGALLGSFVPVIGTAIGAALGGALGGAMNALFGRKPYELESDRLKGTFSTSGADISQYTRYESEGGAFSSDKHKRVITPLTGDPDTLLDQKIMDMTNSVKGFATSLGLSADAVDGYSESIRINLKKLKTPEEIEEALNNAVVGFGEGMAEEFYAAVDEFRKPGETTLGTLARLATSLTNVNATFDVLGLSLYDVSLAGASAAAGLVEMFGGLEQFSASTSFYYENFYTEAERASKTTEQLTGAFSALGYELPATREGFRDIIDGLDLTTESGQGTYASLLLLAPAFTTITDSVDEFGESISNLQAEFDKGLLGDIAGLIGDNVFADLVTRWVADAKEIAEADAQELDTTLLRSVRSAQFSNVLAGLLDDADKTRLAAKKVYDDAVTDEERKGYQDRIDLIRNKMQLLSSTMERTLRVEGADDTADLFSLLVRQWGEMNAALDQNLDTTDLTTLQLKEFNKALAAIQKNAWDTWQEAEADLAEAIADGIRENTSAAIRASIDIAKAWQRVAEDVRKTLENLLGGDLSTLSPQQKLMQAGGLFNTTLAKAQGGDVEAAGMLSGYATDYAEAARGYYASGTQYAAIFDQIIAGLGSVGGIAGVEGAKVDPLEEKLAALNTTGESQVARLTKIRDEAKTYYEESLKFGTTANELFTTWKDTGVEITGLQALVDKLTPVEDLVAEAKKSWDTAEKAYTDMKVVVGLFTSALTGNSGPLQSVIDGIILGLADAEIPIPASIASLGNFNADGTFTLSDISVSSMPDPTPAINMHRTEAREDARTIMEILRVGFATMVREQGATNEELETMTGQMRLESTAA